MPLLLSCCRLNWKIIEGAQELRRRRWHELHGFTYLTGKKKPVCTSVSYLCTFIFEDVLVQSRHELTCFAVQWRTPFFFNFLIPISKPLVSAATCNDLFCSCVEEHFFLLISKPLVSVFFLRVVYTNFARIMTWILRDMITEERSYILIWHFITTRFWTATKRIYLV